MSDAGVELATNRALWTALNAAFTDDDAWRAWTAGEITWGLFRVRERDVGVLGDVAGLDVVELGCGTAYVSAWLAARGPGPSASTSPKRSCGRPCSASGVPG